MSLGVSTTSYSRMMWGCMKSRRILISRRTAARGGEAGGGILGGGMAGGTWLLYDWQAAVLVRESCAKA
jgi:hypothetical protein